MDFLTIKTRVAEEAGLDLENADDLSSIESWVNQTNEHVSSLFNWDWLYKQNTIQTAADITTGTATITANSTTLTLSTAPSNAGSNISVANQWMVNFPSVGTDWYFISSHVSGSTTLTLSVPFVSSSNLSAGSYKLRKVLYTLPTDLDRIIDIRQQTTGIRLDHIDPRTFDAYLPNPTQTGTPTVYSFSGRDTSTSPNWQIALYPTPTSILNLQLKYYKHVAVLVSDSAVPEMPRNYHDILVFGALYLYGHPFLDDDRFTMAKARYTEALKEMKANHSHVPDGLTVIQPWDNRPVRRGYNLGDNYPVVRY